MLKRLHRILPWIILSLPFLILAIFYNALPEKVLIARSFDGSDSTFAPKTLFTVFRVALIEVVCALIIELMRRRFADLNSEARFAYYSMWSVLLYTVAFKSVFQTFEDVSSNEFKPYFFYITFGVVIAGILAALLKIGRSFSAFSRGDWKLSRTEKFALAFLFLTYIFLAFIPIIIFN